ncbi:BrnA antitoxin family protein [Salmonella enterica]|nr:BrnA antitoxin family protein [Salmonella enterica]
MSKKEKNIVRLTLDPDNLPPLTAEEKAQLEALAAMPDELIDYSDAPYKPDAVWMKAGKFPEPKKQVTLRLDADVLDYFRHAGNRYQTHINAVLRSYVEAHKTRG